METILGILLVAGVVAFFVYRKSILRVLHVTQDQASDAARGYERSKAVAVQQGRIDEAAKLLRQWRNRLADANAQIKTPRDQVDKLVNEIAALKTLLEQRRQQILNLKTVPAAESETDKAARESLLQKLTLSTSNKLKELAARQSELDSARALLKTLSDQAETATENILSAEREVEDAQKQLDSDRSQLNMAVVNAEIAQTTSSMGGMTSGSIRNIKDGAKAVREQINRANAMAETIQRLDVNPEKELEKELAAMDNAGATDATLQAFLATGDLKK